MNLADLNIRARLFMAVEIPALAMLVVGCFGPRSLSLVNANVDGILDSQLMPVLWVNEVDAIDDLELIGLEEALLNGDVQAGQSLRKRYQQTAIATEDLWNNYAGIEMAEGELAEKFSQARTDYIAVRNTMLDALVGNQLEQPRRFRKTGLTLIRKRTAASNPVASVQRIADAGQDVWAEFQVSLNNRLRRSRNTGRSGSVGRRYHLPLYEFFTELGRQVDVSPASPQWVTRIINVNAGVVNVTATVI
jgi:Four helix bundle sensory module for signal transduction